MHNNVIVLFNYYLKDYIFYSNSIFIHRESSEIRVIQYIHFIIPHLLLL